MAGDGGETVPIQWAKDDDSALMDRVREGDSRALELLVQRWMPRLGGFLYRFTGDAGAVEDLIQETFLRVHAARASWQPGGNFSAWVHTIARRLAMDRARSLARNPQHRATDRLGSPGATTSLIGKIPDNAPTPYTACSKLELLARLDQALRQVPDLYREAVILCDLQRLSYEEAAQILGTNAKTVSSRLARGRDALREALAAYRSGPIR